MMNDRITGPIVGAGLEPCKVKKQLQLQVKVHDSNLEKLKQKKEISKHQQFQLQVPTSTLQS
jgi:hypothetical protein